MGIGNTMLDKRIFIDIKSERGEEAEGGQREEEDKWKGGKRDIKGSKERKTEWFWRHFGNKK